MNWKCEACGASLFDEKPQPQWNAIHDSVFRGIFKCAPHSIADENKMYFRISITMTIVHMCQKETDMDAVSNDEIIQKCKNEYKRLIKEEWNLVCHDRS